MERVAGTSPECPAGAGAVPRQGQAEPSPRRGARRRSPPAVTRRLRTGAPALPRVPAPTTRKPDRPADRPTRRATPGPPAVRPRLPVTRGLPALRGVSLAGRGPEVSGRGVPPRAACEARTAEENRPHATPTLRPAAQLVSCGRSHLLRFREGLEQQSQTDQEKSRWLSHRKRAHQRFVAWAW